MLKNPIINTVMKFAEEGLDLTVEEFKGILDHCERKMDVAKIADRDEYRPLLFEDEIKNFFIRRSVNTVTIQGREALCVNYAEATPA